MTGDPHAAGAVAQGGAPLARARLAMVMVHGRGGKAGDMLRLGEQLALPDVACLAAEAAGHSWWPQSFLAPLAANEPGLSSGLRALQRITANLEEQGFGPERTIILGFSQGACLALEFAARTGRSFRAVLGFSGGLLGTGEGEGPPRDDLYGQRAKRFDYTGSLDGKTVFIGCHERDPHIPLARVRESEAVFKGLGADVTLQIYPGSGHAVVEEEIRFLRGLANL